MEIAGWIIFGFIIVVIIIAGLRNANQGYTIGSGMFKNSDGNLNKDEHLDPSDYDYYNHKGKLK